MGREAAVRAYRDSVYDAELSRYNMRVGSRSTPIVGGFVSGLELLGNALWRPFKVGGALILGYDGASERSFPDMPEIPPAFKGTELEEDFRKSWKFREEAANSNVKGISKLLNMDITGWWQDASVAAHVEAKDRSVTFPEENVRSEGGAGAAGGFVSALLTSRGDGGRSI